MRHFGQYPVWPWALRGAFPTTFANGHHPINLLPFLPICLWPTWLFGNKKCAGVLDTLLRCFTERICQLDFFHDFGCIANYFLPFSSFWITCLSRINFYIPSPTYFPISSLLQDLIQSAFEDIISDELKKIEDSSLNDFLKSPASAPEANDVLWEYDGLHSVYQGECEEILLEMQRIFYVDYRAEPTRKGETWSHCFSLTHTRT